MMKSTDLTVLVDGELAVAKISIGNTSNLVMR